MERTNKKNRTSKKEIYYSVIMKAVKSLGYWRYSQEGFKELSYKYLGYEPKQTWEYEHIAKCSIQEMERAGYSLTKIASIIGEEIMKELGIEVVKENQLELLQYL